jgi:hypothetical protein
LVVGALVVGAFVEEGTGAAVTKAGAIVAAGTGARVALVIQETPA